MTAQDFPPYLFYRLHIAVWACFLPFHQGIAGVFDNKSEVCPNPVFTTPLSSAHAGLNAGYKTIEEARFALRNALLNYSQECQTTRFGFYQGDKPYNEVLGYIVQRPDGNYEISKLSMGDSSTVSGAMPDGAVESMHTHPWNVEFESGTLGFLLPDTYTALGPSGQDIQTARDQRIPAFVLDCASGDVYGASQDGKALKMVCDNNSGTCGAFFMNGKAVDKIVDLPGGLLGPSITREYSQQELDARYQDHLQQQQRATQVCQPEYNPSFQSSLSETGLIYDSQSQAGDTLSEASVPAQAYETIDYRPVKNWATETINSAYSQATGIADSEGFGAEYRSRVSPIVNQSLNYIQSIPDQVQVPAGQ